MYSEIVLLHCVSIYPPKDEQVNLNNIDDLEKSVDDVKNQMTHEEEIDVDDKTYTLEKLQLNLNV